MGHKTHTWHSRITEQYLWEQIKKGTGHLKVTFIETIPAEHGRISKSYTADSQMNVGCNDR